MPLPMRILAAFCLLLIHFVAKCQARFYCYAPQGVPGPMVTPTCTAGLDYSPEVQLCCAQMPLSGVRLLNEYDVLPTPGIPSNCHHAIHLPRRAGMGMMFECPDTTQLCQSDPANTADRFHLCCSPSTDQCPEIHGIFDALISFSGTGFTNLGERCTYLEGDPQVVVISGIGHVCPDGSVWEQNARCCIATGIRSPLTQGQQPRTGPNAGRAGTGLSNSNCQDRTVPGRASDCPASQRLGLCDNALYRDLMTVQCPRTCKRCGQTPANAQFFNANVPAGQGGGCFDRVGPNGQSDCPAREGFCRIPVWSAFMRLECPFTCKLCTSSSATSRPGAGLLATTLAPVPAGLDIGGNRNRN